MTASTAASRSGRRSAAGTLNGMPASLIFVFARVSRRFMVSAETRNALRDVLGRQPRDRAQRQRDLRLDRQGGMAAGEDELKPLIGDLGLVHFGLRRCSAAGAVASSSRSLAASTRSRRSRSIARFRAVVTSHAAGLAGMPSAGQRRAATANASATDSSASSKSPR